MNFVSATPNDVKSPQRLCDILNQFTEENRRVTISYKPVYDLAGNALSVAELIPLDSSTQTVPANDTFSFARYTQPSGSDVTFTVGASAIATGPYASLTAGSGSDSTSSVYGGVFHATNAGPGTVRGAHLAGIASSGSTGHISAAALQIQPVTTTALAWGGFASLTSSGANGLAVAYGIETDGDTYALGVGSAVAPVGYTNACYRAWMAAASGTNARALQVLNNAGTEIAYLHKDGSLVTNTTATLLSATGNTAGGTGPALIFGLGAIGIYIGSGAPTISAPQGSLYLRSDGSSTSTRAYINTNGSTGWTAITTAT